jgi:hypothetical protein
LSSEAATTTSSPAPSGIGRCKGSPEPEKCEALERKLAKETPLERKQRLAALEAERSANMARVKAEAGLVARCKDESEREKCEAHERDRLGFGTVDPAIQRIANEAAASVAADVAAQAAEKAAARARLAAATPPVYVRPYAAPNGQMWPIGAAYVPGYRSLNTGGYSEVTIDNSRNDVDVFVKLAESDGLRARMVRHIFIPAGEMFTAKGVRSGSYDVRYQILDTGGLFKTEKFTLTEDRTDSGVDYSTVRLTLYKVRDGNMKTVPISEGAFN